MDSAFDVPDATDWLDTPLKDFAGLENALHCQICKEFYDTPMITSCAHTFCSKCIRTSLSADGKCPACRSTDQANKLRNNWALQEVVSAFLAARTPALQIARIAQEEKTTSNDRRKRKRPQASDTDDAQGAGVAGRTTRSKSRRLAASQGSETIEIIDSDGDGDGDFEPEDDDKEQPDDGLVECPLGCGRRMKIESVEPHLDRCEEERERDRRPKSRTPVNGFAGPKGSTQKGARPLERINELNYSLLKDAAMTKKLNELGIPSWGSKQLMINRHREWVNLWNANCDSSNPRTKRDLLHDLDVWERTQGGRAPNANGLSNSIMRKDFDANSWARKNHDDFSRLIADAKRKKHHPAMLSELSKNDQGAEPDQTRSTPIQATPSNEPALPQLSSSGAPDSEKSDMESSGQSTGLAVHAESERKLPSDASPHIPDVLQQITSLGPTEGPSSQSVPLQPETTLSEPPTNSCNLSSTLPLQGPKKVPMFTSPEQALQDIDRSTK